jgi:serine/threonine protein kinase/tetratricopeptide (TPR) repeat protein
VRPDPLTREEAASLAAELVAEMIARWRQGDRPGAEDLLARHPGLWQQPEAAADLIYEEVCLRQEYGAELPTEQVLARFPQWRPQLAVLLGCQRLLGPGRPPPRFPAAGEALGDFLLLAELGRGAESRVFLASQLSLGARPVVLKLSPLHAEEHLSLARLQHTHIVPLYSALDHPDRGLRALCMPYFGGTTLGRLLAAMGPQPPAERTGRDLLDALERAQARTVAESGVEHAGGHGPCPFPAGLAAAPYAETVCWVGACLAEALQYAHERGLVHLDLKPSNVLLTADGQPMVLDFHLAREPIPPGGERPTWLGGTPGYMSAEQEAALRAVTQGRPPPLPVDGRSDVYSLGVVLYEALGGSAPAPGSKPRPLHRGNPRVSVGLSDVVGKCLAVDPDDRYPDMADLAADLRRHLAHRPLAGVRNRSLGERWRKWRRRHPHRLSQVAVLLAALAAAGAAGVGMVGQLTRRAAEARAALVDAQAQEAGGEWEAAVATLRRGLSVARATPFQHELADELERRLRLAEQGRDAADRAAAARELHELADRLRFLYGADALPTADPGGLRARCGELWQRRDRVVGRLAPGGAATLDPEARDDLLELAIFWADSQERLAMTAGKDEGRRKALAVLDEAEALLGPGPVLDAERAVHGGRAPRETGTCLPRTAWERCALGRALLRSGELERAHEEFRAATRLHPQGLWPNFYRGLCDYRRGRYEEAVSAFSVCIGAAPRAAACFCNRALALAAWGRTGQALEDCEQALRLDPDSATALLARGTLHHRAGRNAAALADLERARELGADRAAVALDLALVHLARGDRPAALHELRRSLDHDPRRPDARKLYDDLRGR